MKATFLVTAALLGAFLTGCAPASPRRFPLDPSLEPQIDRFAAALEQRAPGRSVRALKEDRLLYSRALNITMKYALEPVDATHLTTAAITGIGVPVTFTGATAVGPVDGAMSAMVETFDDQAAWLELVDRDESASIGLQLGILENNVYVVEVSPGGPAEQAGVRPFDRLLAIDGRQTASLDAEEILALLYGPSGSRSTISIARGESPQPTSITLVRTPTRIRSVRAERLPGDVVYARILAFVDATKWDLETELNRISSEAPVKGLVLDLRFNAGGQLNTALEVANLFLGSGMLAILASRDPAKRVERPADPWRDLPKVPAIVLVNGSTAGGAEMVAAALVENGYARSLGTVTYGHEKVQLTYFLSPTRALKLTTHRVLTPKGASLAFGLVPGIEMKEADRPMDVECFRDPVVLRAAAELAR